jgi:hypothetical protein
MKIIVVFMLCILCVETLYVSPPESNVFHVQSVWVADKIKLVRRQFSATSYVPELRGPTRTKFSVFVKKKQTQKDKDK